MKDPPRLDQSQRPSVPLLGLLSAVLVFLERPALRVAGFLVVAVWSFCRFYYFAFYVLERDVDPAYRFSGLFSLARHLLRDPVANLERSHLRPDAQPQPKAYS